MATPDDLEQQIARLPRERVRESFAILAEWLKESRRGLETQIKALSIRQEEVARDSARRSDDLLAEQRKTNGSIARLEGRVTDLEQSKRIDAALADGHEEWESEHEAVKREATEAREQRREKRHDRLMSVALVLLGMFGGVVVPAFLKHLGVS